MYKCTAVHDSVWEWGRMSRLKREWRAEPVSRDQILRRERGQGKTHVSLFRWPQAGLASIPGYLYCAESANHTNIYIYNMYIYNMRTSRMHQQGHYVYSICIVPAYLKSTYWAIWASTTVPIKAVGKERGTNICQSGFLNRQHPLLELPWGLLALCRRTLGSERLQHTMAWPDRFGIDPMAIDSIFVNPVAESGRNPVSKYQILPVCG